MGNTVTLQKSGCFQCIFMAFTNMYLTIMQQALLAFSKLADTTLWECWKFYEAFFLFQIRFFAFVAVCLFRRKDKSLLNKCSCNEFRNQRLIFKCNLHIWKNARVHLSVSVCVFVLFLEGFPQKGKKEKDQSLFVVVFVDQMIKIVLAKF